RSDNRLRNLCWASFKTQSTHKKPRIMQRKGREVIQYDLEGNLIQLWPAINIAAKALSKSKARNIEVGIGQCCAGLLKTAYGYKWSFKTMDIIEGEEWKQIEGHPLYYVSNFGRFKKLLKRGRERELCQEKSDTYVRVKIEDERHFSHI